jgi:hypothetical protein
MLTMSVNFGETKMSLSAKAKQLLNLFSQSQPALQDKDKPAGAATIFLGDTLENLSSQEVVEATYDFAKLGGAISAKQLGLLLPKDAIVTQIWTDALTALTSGGSATVALSAGSDALLAATAFNDAALSGTDQQLSAPVKLANGGQLTLTIAAAALTAGKLRVCVAYLKPAK